MEFSNVDEIRIYYENVIVPKVLIAVGNRLLKDFKDIIQQDVYNAYTPLRYQRTFEFLNCLSFDTGDNNSITFYFDEAKIMTINMTKDGHMGQHSVFLDGTVSNGQEFAEFINDNEYHRDFISELETFCLANCQDYFQQEFNNYA